MPTNVAPGLRLLVTGATGFIGSRLVLYAHRVGLDVLGTGRAETCHELERLAELREQHVPVEPGLLQDSDVADHVTNGRSVLIHLAAAQHESAMPDSYFRATNVDALHVLLDACRRNGVGRIVYGSTIGVYGRTNGEPINEDTPTHPGNIYTRTKLEAEGLVKSASDAIQTCVIRIGETYGPGDLRLLKLFRAIDRGRFLMIGSGHNQRQCIHIEDLVRGLLVAATHPAAVNETFIMAGGELMSTNEMVRHIAEAVGRPVPRGRLPLFPFVAAAYVLETVLPPLRIQPPLHSRRLDFFRTTFTFSIAKAHTVLGFRPEIDFRTGALDTANWYRARGTLPTGTASGLAHT